MTSAPDQYREDRYQEDRYREDQYREDRYREIVRHYAQGGQLSAVAQQILEQQRRALNLLTEEAAAIEQSILQPETIDKPKLPESGRADSTQQSDRPPNQQLASVQDSSPEKAPSATSAPHDAHSIAAIATDKSLSEPWRLPEEPPEAAKLSYQSAFAQAIRMQFPPDDIMRLGLRSLQQTLGLSDATIEAIEIRALEEMEAEQQQYRENLEQYREEFDAARQSLHNESVQDELWALQRRLGLRSEDVLRLERDVIKAAQTPVNHDLSASVLMSLASPQLQALEQELFEAAIADSLDLRSHDAAHVAPEKAVPDVVNAHVADAHVADSDLLMRSGQSPTAKEPSVSEAVLQPEAQFLSDPLSQNAEFGAKSGAAAELGQSINERGSDAPVALNAPLSELDLAFQSLELHLSEGSSRDWWKADQMTHQILLNLAANDSSSWLDTEAIMQIHQTDALQQIDRLWRRASSGRFGLLAQRQVYDRVIEQLRQQYQTKMKPERLQQLYIQEFVHELGWWDNRLQFLKFYKWLSFESDLEKAPDIPQGQFPAYWFWAIPRRYALQLGGIGFGQGGWRIDVPRLEAWISKLTSCKFDP